MGKDYSNPLRQLLNLFWLYKICVQGLLWIDAVLKLTGEFKMFHPWGVNTSIVIGRSLHAGRGAVVKIASTLQRGEVSSRTLKSDWYVGAIPISPL